MPKPKTTALTPFDAEVLSALRKGCAATYVVRNRMASAFGPTPRTARVLAALKRLEAKSLVRRMPTSSAVMISWEVVTNG